MKKVRLVEVVNDFNKIRVPLSSNQRKLLKKIYPYYGAQGIVDYVEDFLFDGEYLLIAEDGENLKSNNQNICNMVKGKFWVNNHAHILQGKKDNLTRYLYYKLNTINFSPFVTGSSQPKLNKENLFSIEFFIHENIKTQRKIAKILSDIDDKIEVLHQINDNLSELAKTIYDYWFVQFDFPDENGKPYKTSGGKMVYNDILKREIPEGWEVDNIFNVASIQYGFPFSTEFFNENKIGVPVIRIRDIKDNQISNFSTEEKIDSKYIIKKGEILIGMDGNFHINYWANDNCYLNQRVVKIQGIELSNIYLKEQIEPYIKTREKSISRTTVGHLSDKDLRSINIIIPNNLIMIKINSFYNNALNKFIENLQQIQHLQSLRDWLLPMLMNGQISVE